MKLLLTNDDGIDAIGLATLVQVAADLPGVTEVSVVAPATAQSGVSHRVTVDHALQVEELKRDKNSCPVPVRWVAVAGTPADCVRVALVHQKLEADWVLSGINDGANLGVDIPMSGTVAAVREAALFGVRGIAWSQYVRRPDPTQWHVSAEMVRSTWERLQSLSLPKGGFWNVNFPHNPERTPSLVMCSPEPQPLAVGFKQTNEGLRYVGDYARRPQTPGRDVQVCFGGSIAISKLSALP